MVDWTGRRTKRKAREEDEADQNKIAAVLEKYTHPLNEQHPGLYNICNGQVAPNTVNVQDALAIESKQSKQFSALLSTDFHTAIKKKVKSMDELKKAVNALVWPTTLQVPRKLSCAKENS